MLNNLNSIFINIVNGIIMVITPILFGLIILDESIIKNKRKLIILIITMICLYILVYLCLDGIFKTIISLIIFIIILKNVFKLKNEKVFFITFIFSTITIITYSIMLKILFIFKMTEKNSYNLFLATTYGNLLCNIIVILISLLISKKFKNIINKKEKNIKKILILITLLCIIYFFYKIFKKLIIQEEYINWILIIVFLLILLYCVFKQKIENNKMHIEYDKLLEYMKIYEKEIHNQRIYHHENKNQLLSIKAKIIDEEKNEEIIKYINSILKDDKDVKKEQYSKFRYLPSNGIKALFYFKVSEAENRGISVTVNISSKVEKSFLKKIDTYYFKQLGRILGVYLDNAIEASELSKKNLCLSKYM